MSLAVDIIHRRLATIMHGPQFRSMNSADQLKVFRDGLDDILQIAGNLVGPNVSKMLEVIMDASFHENVSLEISRQIFTDISSKVLPRMDDTLSKSLALFMLDRMVRKAVSFEDQISNIRLHLATIYEKEKNWKDAIVMLISNPLESRQKLYSDDYKLAILTRIAGLYLEDNDPLQAESYINRASIFQSKDVILQTCYTSTRANVLDKRQKFIDAAHEYYKLSLRPNITGSETITLLNSAIVCAILSPVDNQRIQMLTTLHKDKRCQTLIRFSILQKLFLYHMIKPDEVDQIETMLSPHHKAKTKYNTSLLTEAMYEHNMLSISRLYKNIKINSLASLLKVDPYKAEIIAAKMISEERMKGSIDQIDGFIHFTAKNKANLIPTWDQKIESLCYHVNRIIEVMNADASIREWMNEYLDRQMSS